MIRYPLYFWTPPTLTPAQEIEVGRQIALEGRDKFLQRTAPFKGQVFIWPAFENFSPREWLAVAIFAAMIVATLVLFLVPLVIFVIVIGGYSGSTLVMSRHYHRKWTEQMLAKYAAFASQGGMHDPHKS
jgi:Flp pilus assembly protein TadB